MPKLSKIRLTGCKYDGLRKEHENSIFDLTRGDKPDHSLFTLKNGGGKGVIMQLIFQILLPETKWGKNNGNQVIAMFHDKKNNLHPFTFHVVLEWVLDTIPAKRLITGIAVKSTIKNTNTEEEEKAGLSYVLYTYEHDNNGYFTVENLPLYDEKDKKARDLDSIEEFLADNKRDFIRYSQTSGKRRDSDYYKYLESRGILRSEWMTLKDINKSEGGISDYFGRASDNKSIFDKIIIPAISQNIKNYSNDDGNNLIEMFRSNLSITKDLPILLKRENDYRELNLSIEPLIENADSGVRFIDRKKRLLEEGNNILFILNDEMEQVNGEVEKWSISLKEGEDEKAELQFEKDNLLYNKDREYYLQRQVQIESLENEYKEIQDNLENKKDELTLYRVNKLLCKKRGVEGKIKNKTLEKENLIKSLDIEDFRERMLELDNEIDIEWDKTKRRWQNQEIDFYGYIDYIDEETSKDRRRRNKYKSKKEELQEEILKFELEKKSLEDKKERLGDYYDSMSLDFPERILEDLNSSKEKLTAKVSLENKEILSIEDRITDIIEEKNREEYIIDEKSKEAQEIQKDIIKKEAQELNIAKKVSKLLFKEYHGSLLDETWFANHLESLNNLFHSKKIDLENINRTIWEKNIQRSLNNEDYFIPNNDLLVLKQAIKEMNIHVESGTEYLYNADKSEGEKILKNNPGFIYSLVIRDLKQWEIIEKNLDKDLFLNSMVPIYIRSEMGKGIETRLRSIENNVENLADSDYYKKWRQNIERDFLEISSTRDNIKNDIEEIEKSIRDIILIYKGKLVFHLNRDLKKIQEFIQDKTATLLSYEEELADLRSKSNIKKSNLEKSQAQLNGVEEKVHLMEDYILYLKYINERKTLIDSVNRDLDDVKVELAQIDYHIEEILDTKDNININYEKWKINTRDTIKRLQAIYDDFSYDLNIDKAYSSSKIPGFSIESDHLISMLDERKIIQEDINGKNLKLVSIEKDLEYLRKDIETFIENLNETSKGWKEYEDLNIPLIEIDIIIEELNRAIYLLEDKKTNIKSNIDTLNGEISMLKKTLENTERQIKKTHKRPALVLEIQNIDQAINNVHRDIESNIKILELSKSELEKAKESRSNLDLNLSKLNYRTDLDVSKGKMENILKGKISNNANLVVDDWTGKMSKNGSDIKETVDEGERYKLRFLRNIENKLEEDKLKEKIKDALTHSNIANFASNIVAFKGMRNNFQQELITLSKDKEKAEEAMQQWINRASIYVIRMIETLKDMTSSMNYTNERGYIFPLVKLKGSERLPKEEEEVSYLLREHFINSIDKTIKENENLDLLDDKFVKDLMADHIIFSKALQGRYPVLEVYKMTEKNEFRYARPREEYYSTWEAINKGEGISTEGSGGQTLSVTTFVNMMIMSFKKKHLGNENPSTVLILDNPFGKASGRHVLDPIFEIADKLHFQLICFAAPEIIKVEISERFPVFWELKIENGKVIHGGRIIKD